MFEHEVGKEFESRFGSGFVWAAKLISQLSRHLQNASFRGEAASSVPL